MNTLFCSVRQVFLSLIWLAILTVGLPLSLGATPVWAADHLEAPFIRQDGRTDINDVFIFHPGDPQDIRRTVIAMTVNPAAGMVSPTRFSENAAYDLLIDQDGDAVEDLIFRTTFFTPTFGADQQLVVQMIVPDQSAEVLARGATERALRGNRNIRVFAGTRDDPFYFDFDGFNNGADFCFGEGSRENFFVGMNISAIVIELPTSLLGSQQIGFWGVTRA